MAIWRRSYLTLYVFLLSIVITVVLTACNGPNPASTGAPASTSSTVSPPLVQNSTSASIPDIVKALAPSVVHVQTEAVQLDFFNRPVPVGGVGTGSILDIQGHILTNNHVVEGAEKIVVTLSGGRGLEAKLIGRDPSTDLAIIKIETPDLTPIQVGSSSELEVGDQVIAIGHALDLPGGPTVTGGLVSALDRSIDESEFITIEHLIQTDAPINPGNSGGPLVNMAGKMVGINTAKVQAGEGIGFSIAIDSVKPLIDELISSGRINRGYLGISGVNITQALAINYQLPVDSGIGVISVASGSPADLAGIKQGDIIVEMAGSTITRVSAINDILLQNREGTEVKIDFYRGTEKRTINVTLGKRPE